MFQNHSGEQEEEDLFAGLHSYRSVLFCPDFFTQFRYWQSNMQEDIDRS